MKRGVLCLAILLLAVVAAVPSEAGPRPDKDWKKFFGHVGVGYTLPEGDFGRIAEDEFAINGGFMYWPQDWAIGLNFDFAYSDHDFKREIINFINDQIAMDPNNTGSITGGEVSLLSGSANGVWGPDNDGPVSFFVTAGVGLDYFEARVFDSGLVYYPPICDPWFWWCVPGGVGPGTFIVGEEDTLELSWNVGIGITIDTSGGSQVFIESRYKTVETDPLSTEIIPITVGFRW